MTLRTKLGLIAIMGVAITWIAYLAFGPAIQTKREVIRAVEEQIHYMEENQLVGETIITEDETFIIGHIDELRMFIDVFSRAQPFRKDKVLFFLRRPTLGYVYICDIEIRLTNSVSSVIINENTYVTALLRSGI